MSASGSKGYLTARFVDVRSSPNSRHTVDFVPFNGHRKRHRRTAAVAYWAMRKADTLLIRL